MNSEQIKEFQSDMKRLWVHAKSVLSRIPEQQSIPVPDKEFHQKVVLEVGHGDHPDGFEPGAVDPRSGKREWDLNKTCAKSCYDHLKTLGFSDVTITDSGGYLTEIGKSFKDCDVFVSIHHNAFSNDQAQGSEALVHKKFWQPPDEALALLIAKHCAEDLRITNRGIKTMNLGVLAGAMNGDKPGQAVCLAEPYFITGKDVTDHEQWSIKSGQAIGKAIAEFCRKS